MQSKIPIGTDISDLLQQLASSSGGGGIHFEPGVEQSRGVASTHAMLLRQAQDTILGEVEARYASKGTDTEENVNRSLAQAKAALECTTDGILVVDSHGKIVGSNQKFSEMWKLPPQILEGGSDREALHCVLAQLKDPYS